MNNILDQLAALGVTKGFQERAAKRVSSSEKSTADALQKIAAKFPDGFIVENRYGKIFNARRIFPISSLHGRIRLELPFRYGDKLRCFLGSDLPLTKYSFVAMDTETSGISNHSASFVFMIGLSYFTPDALIVDQFILPDLSQERAFLEAVRETCSRFDAIVTYNGKAFDVPMIQAREKMLFVRDSFEGLAHIDLLPVVRRFWRKTISGCRLANVETEILEFGRSDDEIPGSMAPDIYRGFLTDGDLSLMGGVSYHNHMDVVSLSAFMLLISEICSCEMTDRDLELRYRIDSFAYRNRLALANLADLPLDFILADGRYASSELSRIARGLNRRGRVDDAIQIYLIQFRGGELGAGEKAAALRCRGGRDLQGGLALYREVAALIEKDDSIGEWSKAAKLDKIKKKIESIEKKAEGKNGGKK